MTPEWLNKIKNELQPAFDLINLHRTTNNNITTPECYNLCWPLGHTPYSSKEDKIKRQQEGIYKETEFDDYILNCNYFNKGLSTEYTVLGLLTKEPQFYIGEHIQKYADAISTKFNFHDKHCVMLVLYKGPGFCMKWHKDSYTANRFQLPIVSSLNGQFGWKYLNENNETEEVWLGMEEGITYWVDTNTTHIFDNSKEGCTERIHFMVDFLDWEPHYERNN